MKSDETSTETSQKKRDKRPLLVAKSAVDFLSTWTQCCFFMKNKNRYCNLARCPTSQFCGAHRPPEEGPSKKLAKICQKKGVALERCPCPIDPSHTIYVHNLESHRIICNIATRERVLREQPYYKEDCNSGTITEDSVPVDQEICPEELLNKVENCYRSILSAQHNPNSYFDDVSAANDDVDDIVFAVAARYQSAADRIRHVKQDSLIVKQMKRYGLVAPRAENGGHSDIFIEFGAGKGLLGLAIASYACSSVDTSPEGAATTTTSAAAVVFVERFGMRRKVDKIFRESGWPHTRLRMDIRHAYLPALVSLSCQPDGSVTRFPTTSVSPSKQRAVLVAKHLCGVATDMTLRSLLFLQETEVSSSSDQEYSTNTPSQVGVAVATCCHHACIWKDFVGQEWLTSHGIVQKEFDVLKFWSGWAHTLPSKPPLAATEPETLVQDDADEPDDDMEDENEEVAEAHALTGADAAGIQSVVRPKGLTREQMSEIGKKVKRIFDHARLQFLREKLGFHAEQVVYCHPTLSPENYLLLAKKDISN